MPLTAHPFATAGGGTLFEYKVATVLAADMIRSRFTNHGGVMVALEMQTGPVGFDDLQVSLELLDGSHRTVHAQCRYVQRFTARDAKFAGLLVCARSAVQADEAAFASGTRRLAVIVDRESPGHASMAALSDIARATTGFAGFVRAVEDNGGYITTRWSHCLQAVEDMDPEVLYRILFALEIRAVEVRTEVSRDSVELINLLAEAWDPPNQRAAAKLSNALFRHLTQTGPVAGGIDMRSLQIHLNSFLPRTIGATTRRAKLGRRLDAGYQRVALSLRAIGLDDDEAGSLATRVITAQPSIIVPTGLTVVLGPMGVGKTTELERLHRQAIDRALDNASAPIPVFLQAREVAGESLQAVVRGQANGLGDPSRVGVHLIIDGLDEVGIRISDLAARVSTLVALMPNSTVVIASRPEFITPLGLRIEVLEPPRQELAAELMSVIDPNISRWPVSRAELTEVLRRPLFAIRYALDHRSGDAVGVWEAQLVDSVGRQAINDLGDSTDAAFELLVRLACRVVDCGGQPADLRSLEATPVQIMQITRSRIIHVANGCASFQLSVLTEWFAAYALLRDHDVLVTSVSSPLKAYRWRYALVQALLQGSARDVDRVMSTLLARAPATAAWVHCKAEAPYTQERTALSATTAIEAGDRVRVATRAWIGPWPRLVEWWTFNGEMPTLGVFKEGNYLVTAWRRDLSEIGDWVIPLPPHVQLFKPDPVWTGLRAGEPTGGAIWPWTWSFTQIRRQVDRWVTNRDLLVDIEICWPELAWDYAHRIVRRSPDVQSNPILRAELEAAIAAVRAHFPEGDTYVYQSRRDAWRLSEAESFVADLYRRDIYEVTSPWPPANTRGSWTWDWWTTDQLLNRLRLATKAGLDAYKAIVEHHLPTMAGELNTYQLLPARIVGTLMPRGPGEGYESQPLYTWYLEPLPAGAKNEAHWKVGETHHWMAGPEWESWIASVRRLRGDVAERLQLWIDGRPQVLSPTPAGALALALLANDLSMFSWTTKSEFDTNCNSTRPRYR